MYNSKKILLLVCLPLFVCTLFSGIGYCDESNIIDGHNMGYNVSSGEYTSNIAAGGGHTVVLNSDGTVSAVGNGNYTNMDNLEASVNDYVGKWNDIVSITAGYFDVYGVKADGTVVSGTPGHSRDSFAIEGWEDIIQLEVSDASYGAHIVGLKNDGTVVATGNNDDGQCDVQEWKDIVRIAVGQNHTLGLKKDGTVLATGAVASMQCYVDNWTDIVQISACGNLSAGLKSDGTVVATGGRGAGHYSLYRDGKGEYWTGKAICEWEDIIYVEAAGDRIMGITKEGSVVVYNYIDGNHDGQCDVGNWSDIVQIAASKDHTVGLKRDGTVVAVGRNDCGQCEVDGMKYEGGFADGANSDAGVINPENVDDGSFVLSGNGMIIDYTGESKNLAIPSEVNGRLVTGIGECAFGQFRVLGDVNGFPISFESVNISSAIKEIQTQAFYGQEDIMEIKFSEGLETIGYEAFYGCNGLTTLSFSNSLKSIGIHAFCKCYNLSTITLNEGLEEIASGAFSDCWNLKYLEIPSTVNKLGGTIVAGSAIKEIRFTGACPKEYSSSTFSDYKMNRYKKFEDLTIYYPAIYTDSYSQIIEWYPEINWIAEDGSGSILKWKDDTYGQINGLYSEMCGGAGSEIGIISNVEWTVSTPEWVHAEPESGVGDGDFTVYVDENIGAARSGEIIVSAPGAETISMHIEQDGLQQYVEYSLLDGKYVDIFLRTYDEDAYMDGRAIHLKKGSKLEFVVDKSAMVEEFQDGTFTYNYCQMIAGGESGAAYSFIEEEKIRAASAFFYNGGGRFDCMGDNGNCGLIQISEREDQSNHCLIYTVEAVETGEFPYAIVAFCFPDIASGGRFSSVEGYELGYLLEISENENNSVAGDVHSVDTGYELSDSSIISEGENGAQEDYAYTVPYVNGSDTAVHNVELSYTVHADGAVKYIEYLNGKVNGEFEAQQEATEIPLTFMSKGKCMLQFSAVYADGTESEKSEKLIVTVVDGVKPEKPLVQLNSEAVYVGEAANFNVQSIPGATLRMYQNNRLVYDFSQTIGTDGTLRFDYIFSNPSRLLLQFSIIVNGIESELSDKIPISVQAASRGNADREYTDMIDGSGTVVAGPGTTINYSNEEKAFIQYLKDSCKPDAKQSFGFENEAIAEQYAIQYVLAVRNLDVTNAYTEATYFVGNTSSARASYVNQAIRKYLLSADGIDDDHPYRVFRNLYQNGEEFGKRNIVFFFDGCSNNCEDGSKYKRPEYNAASVCIVIRRDEYNLPVIKFVSHNASTIPCYPTDPKFNEGDKMATLKDGVYNIFTWNHKNRYAALQVGFLRKDFIRCSGYNKYFVGEGDMPPINIHTRTSERGVIVKEGTPNSQGCLNIGGIEADFAEYNAFMEVVAGITNAVNSKFPTSSKYSGNTILKKERDAGLVIVDRKRNAAELVSLYGKDAAECLLGIEIDEIDDIDTSISAPQVQEEQAAVLKQFLNVDESIVEPAHRSTIVEGESLILKWNAIAGAQTYMMKMRDTDDNELCFENANSDGFIEIDAKTLTTYNNIIALNLDSYLKKGALQTSHSYNIYIRPCAPGYAESSGTYNMFTVIPKNMAEYFLRELTPANIFTANENSTITVSWQAPDEKKYDKLELCGYKIDLKLVKNLSYYEYAEYTLDSDVTMFTKKLDEWVRLDGKTGIEQNNKDEYYALLITPILKKDGMDVRTDDAVCVNLVVYCASDALESPKRFKVLANEHNGVFDVVGGYNCNLPIQVTWEFSDKYQNAIDSFVLEVHEKGKEDKEPIYQKEIANTALRHYIITSDALKPDLAYSVVLKTKKIVSGVGYTSVSYGASNIVYIATSGIDKTVATQMQAAGSQSNSQTTVTSKHSIDPIWPLDDCFQINTLYYYSYGEPHKCTKRNDTILYTAGIDIDAPLDKPVKAIEDGDIILVGTDFGLCLKIDHGNGYYSLYGHLNKVCVSKENGTWVYDKNGGTAASYIKQDCKMSIRVNKGDIIAYTGNTGKVSGPHLHLDVYQIVDGNWNQFSAWEEFYRDKYKAQLIYASSVKTACKNKKDEDVYARRLYDYLSSKGETSQTQASEVTDSKLQSGISASNASYMKEIASLSSSLEGDVETVSDGRKNNDAGKTSYGLYQFAEAHNKPWQFVVWLGKNINGNNLREHMYNKLYNAYNASDDPYSPLSEFSDAWKTLGEKGSEYRAEFAEAQTEYAVLTYRSYIKAINKANYGVEGLDEYGSEKNIYPKVIHQMIWARSMQGAPKAQYIAEAYALAKGDYSNDAVYPLEGPQGDDIPGNNFLEKWVFRIYWEASKYTDPQLHSAEELENASKSYPNLASGKSYYDYKKEWNSKNDKINLIEDSNNSVLNGKCLVYFHSSGSDMQKGVFRRLNPYGKDADNEYRMVIDRLRNGDYD